MATSTKKLSVKLALLLVFLYLVFFPLGKLARANFVVSNFIFSLNLLDFLVAFSLPVYLAANFEKPKLYRFFKDFFVVSLFSLMFSLLFFPGTQVLVNSLYLVRLVFYYYFFAIIWNLVNAGKLSRDFLVKSLVLVSFFVALLGWLQYIFVPDLTSLKFWGWDDHLFRLTSTFLDPSFTGIFLVFGFLCSLLIYFEEKRNKYLVICLTLVVSLLFTYSRASYLAFFTGVFTIFWLNGRKYFGFYFLLISVFVASLFVLPRLSSEGTLLERKSTVQARLTNYSETFEIIKKYPVFGVGFNNMCPARLKFFGGNPESHACPGADSSILFVLATTGMVGFFVFVNLVIAILRNLSKSYHSKLFVSCFAALVIHSLFVQSALYPYTLGFMGILYAASLKS